MASELKFFSTSMKAGARPVVMAFNLGIVTTISIQLEVDELQTRGNGRMTNVALHLLILD